GGQPVSDASCHASFTVPPRAGPPRTRLPHGIPTSPARSPTQPVTWCMIWCMVRTNIYLEERQTAILDQIASEEGVSRAEIIRRLIDRALAGRDDDLAADLAAIDESFGALRELDLPARGTRDRVEHLARM